MVHVIHATTNHCNEMYVSLHREVTKSFVASQASAVLCCSRLETICLHWQEGEHFLGRFSQQTTAARACDVASLKVHGASAATHFPAR